MTDDDRELVDLLRRYEARLPADTEPPLLARRSPLPAWALAAVGGGLPVVAVLVANLWSSAPPVGDASPTAAPSEPTASTAPTASPDPATWGPLAVIATGGQDARNEGTLVITEECTFFDVAGAGIRQLLVWPAERTQWNAADRSITFTNIGGGDVQIRDSDYLVLGGGGSSRAEGGEDGETWAASIDWVHPPAAECLTDERWTVSNVASIGAPSPTPGPSPAAWVALPTAGEDSQLAGVAGVVEWNGLLVAAGKGGLSDGAIWVSADGTTWETAIVPSPPSGMGVALQTPFAVEDRLLVSGITFHPAGSGPVGSVLWTSADGRAWSELPASAQLTNAPLGLIGVSGRTIVMAERHEIPDDSAFWVSPDAGSTWERVPIDPPDGSWPLHGLVDDGTFFAVGTVYDGIHDQTAEVWSSPDGLGWERTDLGAGRAVRIAALEDGRLLVIGETDDAPLGWTSVDGHNWQTSAIDLGCCGFEFVVAPPGLAAVQGADDGSGSVVYTSSDGLSWSVSGPFEGIASGVTWTESFGIVIHGRDASGRPAIISGWKPG